MSLPEKNPHTSIMGCVVTDDKYISRKDGGELIEWLKDGSIGVIHHNGNFFEGKV